MYSSNTIFIKATNLAKDMETFSEKQTAAVIVELQNYRKLLLKNRQESWAKRVAMEEASISIVARVLSMNYSEVNYASSPYET